VQGKQNKTRKQKGTKYVNEGGTATRCAKKGKAKKIEEKQEKKGKHINAARPSHPRPPLACLLAS
jgi:hypothetical protein